MRRFAFHLLGIICLMLAAGNKANAQSFFIRNFNSENGLPQNTIKYIQFDDAGFLWIATENGLLRFDGTTFQNYNDVLHERITRLVSTTDNRRVVVDLTGKTCELRNGKIWPLLPEAPKNRLNPDILEAVQLDKATHLQFVKNNTFSSQLRMNVLDAFPLGKDMMVMAHVQHVSVLRKDKKLFTLRYPGDSVVFNANPYTLFKSNNEVILLDRRKGFYQLDITKQQWKLIRNETGFSRLNALSLIWKNKMQPACVVDRNALFQLSLSEGAMKANKLIDSLVHKTTTTCMEYDPNSGTYVLGTINEGLYLYHPSPFKTLKKNNISQFYYGQVALNGKAIQANNGDVLGLEPSLPSPLPVKTFTNYTLDRGNDVYFSEVNSILRYQRNTGRTDTVFAEGNSQEFAFDEYRDTLWVVNSNGIRYVQNGKTTKAWNYPVNDRFTTTYSMLRVDATSFLWGNCQGLFRYHTPTREIDTLIWKPDKCVRSLWRYKDYVFIGTYGDGWKVWNRKKIISMPLDAQGYQIFAHCFIPDKKGFLWITSNHGLFKYYLQDIIDYVDGRRTAIYSYHYSHPEGIENVEFNGGCFPCALSLQNGYTSLPNMAGLVWFVPEATQHYTSSRPMIIDRIALDGKKINRTNQAFEIPSSVKVLEVQVLSPYLGNINNDPIEYRLVGFDSTWRFMDRRKPMLTYTTLPSGKYLLEFRKAKGFGQSGFFTTSIPFTVLPPWFVSAGAILIWLLLLLLIILVIIRIRTSRYRKRQAVLEKLVEQKVAELKTAYTKLEQNVEILETYQKELLQSDLNKTRLINIISHDMIGPLRFVSMVSRQIEKEKSQIDRQQLLDTVKDINETCNNLLTLSTDILNWMNYQKGDINIRYQELDLYYLIEDKIDLFSKIAAQKGIALINDCPEDFILYNDRNLINILLQNLINNALKFTVNGSIQIMAGMTNGNYCLEVKDTGLGMSIQQIENILQSDNINSTPDAENKKSYGLGFMIIRDLVRVTHGSIEIDSEMGKGTIVRLLWPLVQPDAIQEEATNFHI